MHCPIDGETLVMADRSGVEIDYCPKCRGVWLIAANWTRSSNAPPGPSLCKQRHCVNRPGRMQPRSITPNRRAAPTAKNRAAVMGMTKTTIAQRKSAAKVS